MDYFRLSFAHLLSNQNESSGATINPL
jgi:hypothetical protein